MTAYSDMILATAGLVGYWRLGETSGIIATDLLNARNGTYTGGYTQNQTGLLTGDATKSTAFNGSTGYVDIPDHDDYSIGTTGYLSVEFWAVLTATDGVVIVGKNGANYEWEVTQFAGPGRITPAVRGSGGGIVAQADGATASAATHHIVVTMDNLGKHLLGYIDGNLGITQDTWSGAISNTTATVKIGQRGDSVEWFNGRVQEVAIYNVVLAPATITAHYNGGLGTFPVGQRQPAIIRTQAVHRASSW